MDISARHIDKLIEKAYRHGKQYVAIDLTGDDNVDRALAHTLDELGYKVAMNDDNILIRWGY
ncbi:hypothetical protein [Megasphaera massiliensis]|jgi:hypothetical protein|uniref:hypothetical protein n=1 Tax=Megasphaera massiliensis TaxID=1232428 RepID=UPI0003F4B54F|nr:hypothetical protein [Megasphaera massiliensis]MCQ5211162.1 hypothetical protein [Megasphaera massiliensis]DAF68441.1 MAG TPA: hypothetical protein [Caudoviricetes sp.]